MSLKKTSILSAAALLLSVAAMAVPSSLIWTIGTEDGSSAEFAFGVSRLAKSSSAVLKIALVRPVTEITINSFIR